ncbi:MAG TPA: hypothetical protein VLI39_06280 [Sedimentisphaerales bacterium]|nr:hypothetical protein [Sedimentisphaerales bacterium]
MARAYHKRQSPYMEEQRNRNDLGPAGEQNENTVLRGGFEGLRPLRASDTPV